MCEWVGESCLVTSVEFSVASCVCMYFYDNPESASSTEPIDCILQGETPGSSRSRSLQLCEASIELEIKSPTRILTCKNLSLRTPSVLPAWPGDTPY